jgi:calcineurin-like phosphoesterase family protein
MTQKTFFTSDTHAGHANIIKHSKRVVFASEAEKDVILHGNARQVKDLRIGAESTRRMDDGLVENWNSVVNPGDIVYHLGDFSLHKNVGEARAWRWRLNGTIRLVRGNHEATADQMRNDFDWVKDYCEAKVPDEEAEHDGKQHITLCHYAFRTWNHSHHGSWHLYGHSHGSLPDLKDSRSFDVGVDCWGYTPISYERVKEVMATKKFTPIDHHTARGADA